MSLVLAAPMLFASGPLQKEWGLTRENAASLRSPAFAPETRATELPN